MLQKGAFGTCGPAGSRFLQSAVPFREGDGGLAALHCPVDSERLRHGDEISNGDRDVCVGVDQERVLDVLD